MTAPGGPVAFLTDEQAEAYGRFVEEPTRPELERFFYLDDVDTLTPGCSTRFHRNQPTAWLNNATGPSARVHASLCRNVRRWWPSDRKWPSTGTSEYR